MYAGVAGGWVRFLAIVGGVVLFVAWVAYAVIENGGPLAVLKPHTPASVESETLTAVRAGARLGTVIDGVRPATRGGSLQRRVVLPVRRLGCRRP